MLLVQSLGGCSSEAPAPAVEQNRASAAPATQNQAHEPLIVAFGDSLFAGYGLGQKEGLAPALDRSLERQGIAVDVVNAGVSGDTSAAGLRRLGFTLDGQPRKPVLVIVGLGANDMLRGVAPSETRANLDAILAELKRRDIPALLSGMVAAPNLGADYARQFNAIYPDLAKEYQVPLYPFILDGVVGQPALILDDGLHPSARGVEVMAQRLGPVVAQALGEPVG
ncbi:MAG TPA: arylesterase [Sphingomicrobium sp.]|nr:arylesterase [Sphingomicrobium sp.]